MREKGRIERITQLIEQIWAMNQDMRLGQLLTNYVFQEGVDIWYQEDDITETILQEAVKK